MDPTLEAVLAGTHRTDLTAEQEQALSEYLETPEGLAALEGLEGDLGQAAQHLEPPVLPDSAWERVNHTIRELGPVGKAPSGTITPLPMQALTPEPPSQLPKFLAMAAAVLLVVGVGVFLPLDVLLGPGGNDTVSSLTDDPAPAAFEQPEVLSLEEGPAHSVKHYVVDDLLVFHVAPKD